jgi:molecular chaperone DnaJ
MRDAFTSGRTPRGGEQSSSGFQGGGFEDIFGAGSQSDIFSTLFGGGSRGARKGQDLQTETTISFRDSIFGREINLRVNDHNITTRVPAGIKDGAKIKLKGRGASGQAGPGDLFIIIHVTKHPVFSRDNQNLLMTLPVTFTEAALGADISVPTLSGEDVTVRLAPGTQNGKVLRVKGRGVTKDFQSGDLLITVEVQVPRRLDSKAKQSLQEFAEATKDDSPRKELKERAGA